MSAVTDAVRQHRGNILAREQAELDRMARYWGGIAEDLQSEAEKVARRMDDLRKAGERISPTLVRQQDRYNRLLRQAADRHVEFSDYAGGLIRDNTRRNAQQGIEDARQVLEEAGVSIGFDNLDIAAVEEMAGLLADGSPVRDVLARRFPDNWEQAEDALLQGIAKGWNPRKVAAAMTSKLGGALSDAARIARTEQLRAYREASRNAYVESGVVEQYKRLATHDTRTCIACIVLDGRIYPTSEPLSDHPNGRCSMVPIVTNRPEPRWESGKTWFNGLDADDQRKILGPAKFNAWQQSQIDLDTLAKVAEDPVWGGTVQVRSLRDALASR